MATRDSKQSTHDPEDLYEVLGVSEGASPAEIRRRYKLLALAWHPDRFPSADLKPEASEHLKQVNRAYQVIGDRRLRERYDGERRRAQLERDAARARAEQEAQRLRDLDRAQLEDSWRKRLSKARAEKEDAIRRLSTTSASERVEAARADRLANELTEIAARKGRLEQLISQELDLWIKLIVAEGNCKVLRDKINVAPEYGLAAVLFFGGICYTLEQSYLVVIIGLCITAMLLVWGVLLRRERRAQLGPELEAEEKELSALLDTHERVRAEIRSVRESLDLSPHANDDFLK